MSKRRPRLKPTKTKLPRELFIRMEDDGDGPYSLTFHNIDDAVERDNVPTVIGIYELVSTKIFTKKMEVVETPTAKVK